MTQEKYRVEPDKKLSHSAQNTPPGPTEHTQARTGTPRREQWPYRGPWPGRVAARAGRVAGPNGRVATLCRAPPRAQPRLLVRLRLPRARLLALPSSPTLARLLAPAPLPGACLRPRACQRLRVCLRLRPGLRSPVPTPALSSAHACAPQRPRLRAQPSACCLILSQYNFVLRYDFCLLQPFQPQYTPAVLRYSQPSKPSQPAIRTSVLQYTFPCLSPSQLAIHLGVLQYSS